MRKQRLREAERRFSLESPSSVDQQKPPGFLTPPYPSSLSSLRNHSPPPGLVQSTSSLGVVPCMGDGVWTVLGKLARRGAVALESDRNEARPKLSAMYLDFGLLVPLWASVSAWVESKTKTVPEALSTEPGTCICSIMVATVINLVVIRLWLLIRKTFLRATFHPFLPFRINGSDSQHACCPLITGMTDDPQWGSNSLLLHPPRPTCLSRPHTLEGP